MLNTAAAVVETHRQVYEAATPVALPSSIAAPPPAVPEALPHPPATPGPAMHVRFAAAIDDADREMHTPKTKTAGNTTPFHKRVISQLPPIVASQSLTPRKDYLDSEESDIEAGLGVVRFYLLIPRMCA